MNNLNFDRLAASEEFAEFSKILVQLTGIPMTLQSPEGDMRFANRYGMRNPICKALRASSEGAKLCSACDMTHQQAAAGKGSSQIYRCHAGFIDMFIPIFVGGRHIASISSGQILFTPFDSNTLALYTKRFPWIRLDEQKTLNELKSLPCMTMKKARLVMKLLETFATQFCDKLRKIDELESRLEREDMRRAKDYIGKQFSDPLMNLAATAKVAGLCPAHFSHLFKLTQGQSFTTYVRNVRVEHASHLLVQTDQSISEICFACGFKSLSDFIRVFHSLKKSSPKIYRNNALQSVHAGTGDRPLPRCGK